MLTYITLIYAFLADIFVFHTSFSAVEVTGVCIVAIFMFSIIVRNLYVKKTKQEPSEVELEK